MKEEQLFEAFSNIDATFIEETKNRRRKILWRVITGLIAIVLIILAILPLLKIQNPYYTIRKIDGEYFLVAKSPWERIKFGNFPWHTFRFDSPQEMKRKFLECDFTEEEIEDLIYMLSYEPGMLDLPDLDHISQPVLPEGITWDGTINWDGFGNGYTFHLSCTSEPTASFSTSTETQFRDAEARLMNYTGDELVEVIQVEHIEDRNATVYHLQSKINGHKSQIIVYTIDIDNRHYIVEEHYFSSGKYMRIWLQDGACYGHIMVDFEVRPNVEWITSFGLLPVE